VEIGSFEEVNLSDPAILGEMGAIELLNALVGAAARRHEALIVVVNPRDRLVQKDDIPELIGRLDSRRPSLGVATASGILVPQRSTECREAAFLIVGYIHGSYPPTIDSRHFDFDPDSLRAWWSLHKQGDLGCRSFSETETLSIDGYLRSSQNAEIMVALFKYMFNHQGSYQRQRAPAYYLKVDDNKDPPPEVMSVFLDHDPPVRPISVLRTLDYTDEDLAEGASIPGIIFTVADVQWKSDTFVTAYGRYYEGRLSAAAATYCLRYEKEKWIVIGWKDTIVY
jgi:hypothetical protein